ncbi:MAG: hypothetical protein R3D34_06795 [Nitratireductor sp.]
MRRWTAGLGLARIARLSEVDHDGDTYVPGAFKGRDEATSGARSLQAITGTISRSAGPRL